MSVQKNHTVCYQGMVEKGVLLFMLSGMVEEGGRTVYRLSGDGGIDEKNEERNGTKAEWLLESRFSLFLTFFE